MSSSGSFESVIPLEGQSLFEAVFTMLFLLHIFRDFMLSLTVLLFLPSMTLVLVRTELMEVTKLLFLSLLALMLVRSELFEVAKLCVRIVLVLQAITSSNTWVFGDIFEEMELKSTKDSAAGSLFAFMIFWDFFFRSFLNSEERECAKVERRKK